MDSGDKKTKHGTIAVLDGQVVVTDPEPGGRAATIVPSENVQIFVNGNLLESPQEVTSADEITLIPSVTEPSWEVECRVSSDGMTAFARFFQTNGEVYQVPDHAASERLVINCVLVSFDKPEIQVSEVIKILNEQKIVYGLMPEMIQLAIDSNSSEEFPVAKGLEPEPGIDGSLNLLFTNKSESQKEQKDSPLVHVHNVISVEPGEELVELVPPKPGKPGKDVYGNPIDPPPPKKVKLIAGSGAKLTAEGTRAIATISGRPVLKGNTIAVVPSYTLQGDIDAKKTGQINFKGDLVIHGNVMDGMKIEATGQVLISGYVANSVIHAGGDVIIEKNLVGGTIRAGGVASLCQRLIGNFNELVKKMGPLAPTIAQLKTHPSVARNRDIQRIGDGVLIRALFNTKLSKVPTLLEDIDKDLEQLIRYYESPELEQFKNYFEESNKKICARVPVELDTVEKIDKYVKSFIAEVEKVKSLILIRSGEKAKLSVQYIQNSLVESSGDVIITGKGCYNTSIYAGANVEIYNYPGVFRSGEISARGNVKIRELGSEAEAVTSIRIQKGKKLIVDKVHPGVVIRAGSRIERITQVTHNLTIIGQ